MSHNDQLNQVQVLKNIIKENFLVNSYRHLEPQGSETTYNDETNPFLVRSSRLDRIYVSDTYWIYDVSHISKTLNFTDHKAVVTKLNSKPYPDKTPKVLIGNLTIHY